MFDGHAHGSFSSPSLSLLSSPPNGGNTLGDASGEVRINTTRSPTNRFAGGDLPEDSGDFGPVRYPEAKYPVTNEPVVQIRRILPGKELTVLEASHLFDHGRPERASVRTYLADPHNRLLFAFERGTAVGFLRATELLQLTSHRKQMFLYEISVDEKFRQRGIGKALVQALLKDCRERGFAEVFVFTDPANAAAVALYRSTGAVTETPADRMFVYPLHSE